MNGEIRSTAVTASCIPAVELAHYLDPYDYDGGPFQCLAPGRPRTVAETTRDAGPVPVSDLPSTPPDVGYPLAG